LEDTLTKDRVETALKVLSNMSPAEVQERLNTEDLSTPIVSVKLKTLVEEKAIWEKRESPKADHLRPLTKKKPHTCLWIKNKRRMISALVDTGSDITVVGSELAKKMRWQIYPTKGPWVLTASEELLLITGEVRQPLFVGSRSLDEVPVYVSPD